MLDKLKFEVPDDAPWRTEKGNRAQKIYVHGLEGSKYPKEITRVFDQDEAPIAPGVYAVGGVKIDWGKVVVDYSKLKPIPAKAS